MGNGGRPETLRLSSSREDNEWTHRPQGEQGQCLKEGRHTKKARSLRPLGTGKRTGNGGWGQQE